MAARSLSSYGLVRVGVAAPELKVADVDFNTQHIIKTIELAAKDECFLLVFPELCITGYTCADLFFQHTLRQKAWEALAIIAEATAKFKSTVVVGAPISLTGRLFNCAILISRGQLKGIVPKTFLPNYSEFYEDRWFASSREAPLHLKSVIYGNQTIPFGTDLLFRIEEIPDAVIGIEICEDVWAVQPPSSEQAVAGATLLFNLSASNEILGKQYYRRLLVESQSGRCIAAYAYASAGVGESSTDLIFSGHSLIAENGSTLAETKRFSMKTELAIADVDIERLTNERNKNTSYAFSQHPPVFRFVSVSIPDASAAKIHRRVVSRPFLPSDKKQRTDRCKEVFSIQTAGLAKRLKHIGAKTVSIGISGGLDSTLALLVCVKAFDQLGLDRKGIHTITMPGFGTTDRTKSNAEILSEKLGTTFRTVPIGPAVLQHFKDIGHDGKTLDITYENSQARERTQILFDIANQVNGIVIGTGDLSELALGWCTYNGDHMSNYGVNSSIPKTLVRNVIEWSSEEEFTGEVAKVLRDICDTPVSPELLPPDEKGEIQQKTEDSVGPYLLHDFFLYNVLRMNYSPSKILWLAEHAFKGEFDRATILHWLKTFYKRFFSQQFKRSCIPDGVKVGTVALSPRGDWRMPSDAQADSWLKELDTLDKPKPKL